MSRSPDSGFRCNEQLVLGACFIELEISGNQLFFGMIFGRSNDILLDDPEKPEQADYLILQESTYGNKFHPP